MDLIKNLVKNHFTHGVVLFILGFIVLDYFTQAKLTGDNIAAIFVILAPVYAAKTSWDKHVNSTKV